MKEQPAIEFFETLTDEVEGPEDLGNPIDDEDEDDEEPTPAASTESQLPPKGSQKFDDFMSRIDKFIERLVTSKTDPDDFRNDAELQYWLSRHSIASAQCDLLSDVVKQSFEAGHYRSTLGFLLQLEDQCREKSTSIDRAIVVLKRYADKGGMTEEEMKKYNCGL